MLDEACESSSKFSWHSPRARNGHVSMRDSPAKMLLDVRVPYRNTNTARTMV
jgi:hypothetical protein